MIIKQVTAISFSQLKKTHLFQIKLQPIIKRMQSRALQFYVKKIAYIIAQQENIHLILVKYLLAILIKLSNKNT